MKTKKQVSDMRMHSQLQPLALLVFKSAVIWSIYITMYRHFAVITVDNFIIGAVGRP